MKKPESIHEFVVNSIYIKLDIEKNNIFIFSLINRDNETYDKAIKSLSKGTVKKEALYNIRQFIKFAKRTPFPEDEIENFNKKLRKTIKNYFVRINRYKVQKGLPKTRKRDEWYD